MTKYDTGSKSAAVSSEDAYRRIDGFTDRYSEFAFPPPTGVIGLPYGEGVFRQKLKGRIRTSVVIAAVAALFAFVVIGAKWTIDADDEKQVKDLQLFHADVDATLAAASRELENRRADHAILLHLQQLEKFKAGDDPNDRLSVLASLTRTLGTSGYDAEMDLQPGGVRWFRPLVGTSLVLGGGESLSLYDTEAAVRVTDLGSLETLPKGMLRLEQISADQRYVLLSSGEENDGSVGVFDLEKRTRVSKSLRSGAAPAHTYYSRTQRHTQLFPDVGRYAFQRDGAVFLYDFMADRQIASYQGSLHETNPDVESGHYLIVYKDRDLTVIDPISGEIKWSRKLGGAVLDAGSTVTGDVFVVDSTGRFTSFDGCGCRPPKAFSVGSPGRLIVSPDNRRMVLISDGSATLWSTETGKMLSRLWQGPRNADDVRAQFIADGRKVLFYGFNIDISVFDSDTGAGRVSLNVKGQDLAGIDARTAKLVISSPDERDETGQTTKDLYVYDALNDVEISHIPLPPSPNRGHGKLFGAVVANNRALVTSFSDRKVWRFSEPNLTPESRFPHP